MAALERFVIKSRTYGNVEFSCRIIGTGLSRMEVYCQSLGWQLETACVGGSVSTSVSTGAPMYVEARFMEQAARKWWKKAKSKLDQQIRPHVGDLRVDTIQWVHSNEGKKQRSHAIVTVKEYSKGEWVHAGKWIAFLMAEGSHR